MSPYVSLTGSEIPRIIPAFHRKIIAGNDVERSDRIVKLYLSWFTLSKLIKVAARPSASLFESITKTTDFVSVQVYALQLKALLPHLIRTYIPWVETIPLMQGLSWRPTWKSLPNMVNRRRKASFLTSWKYEVSAYAKTLLWEVTHGTLFFCSFI